MKKYFITYGDKNYSIQSKRIGYQAKMFDFFDEVIIYKKRDLTKDFNQRFSNKKIEKTRIKYIYQNF